MLETGLLIVHHGVGGRVCGCVLDKISTRKPLQLGVLGLLRVCAPGQFFGHHGLPLASAGAFCWPAAQAAIAMSTATPTPTCKLRNITLLAATPALNPSWAWMFPYVRTARVSSHIWNSDTWHSGRIHTLCFFSQSTPFCAAPGTQFHPETSKNKVTEIF